MEYVGDLYGKENNRFVKLQETSQTFDELKARIEKLENDLAEKDVELKKIQDLYANTYKTLKEKEKRFAYYEARFVECTECTPDKMKDCPMHYDYFCNGERCVRIVDLEALLEKGTDVQLNKALGENGGQ